MKNIFERVLSIKGVISGIVIDSGGNILLGSLPGDFNTTIASQAIQQIVEIGYVIESLDGSEGSSEIVIRGTEHMTIIRLISDLFVVLYLESDANLAAATIGLNSAILKEFGSTNGSEPQSTSISEKLHVPTGTLIERPTSQVQSKASTSTGSLVNTSKSMAIRNDGKTSLLGDWGDGKIPTDAVDMGLVNHIAIKCELFLGPESKQILIDIMKGLNASPKTLRVRHVAEVIERVASHIDDPRQRKAFRAEVMGDS